MKKLLGIDYGTKNIGIAIGKNGFVNPEGSYKFKENHPLEEEVIAKIAGLVISEHIDIIVIGEPMMHNSVISKSIQSFRKKLKKQIFAIDPQFSFTITSFEEYKSSEVSVGEMIRVGVSQKNRSEDHAFAAAKILSDYMKQFPS